MCNLHDALQAGGYTGHELKRFLVRILFCLFAEDNGIFPQKAFELFLLRPHRPGRLRSGHPAGTALSASSTPIPPSASAIWTRN